MIALNITDVCCPRLTNSLSYSTALDWVTVVCKQWGLVNAGRQARGDFGKGRTKEVASLQMKVSYYENIIAYPVLWYKGTNKAMRAEVVMLNKLDAASMDKVGASLK